MQGRSTPRFLSIRRAIACALLLVAAPAVSLSQESPTSPKPSEPGATESPRKETTTGSAKSISESALPKATIRYLMNKSGELVPVVNDVSWEDFLKFLESRSKPATGPQTSTITGIEITGTVDEDRANLKVAYTISLPQADEFVSVPLYLNDAVLLKPETYTGDGAQCPFEKKDPELGFVWWFRGRGPHRLELSVSVPLRKQFPSRRLVLSLPPSPYSRATIRLPYNSVNVKSGREQTIVESVSSGDGKSEIVAIDLGSRFDLVWSPAAEQRVTSVSLESQSTIRAAIEVDHLHLRAEQTVKSLQGAFDKFEVRLPTGAEFVRLEESEKLSYRIDPKNPQKALISLKEKSNSVQLNWNMQIPVKSRTVTLDGLAVEGATKESGRIGLSIAEGLRFSSEPSDPSVVRINAGEFPSNMGSVVRAYQFLGQPFKLTTKLDEVKPYFQVRPQLSLKASSQQLELDGAFEYRVDRDTLNEVVLTWPEYKSEGWVIESVDEPGIVESHSIDDKGQILVRLVKHQAGRFTLHMRAHRPIKSGEDALFTLPRPKSASRLSATTVTIANAENVETELSTRGETSMQQVSSSSVELPETMRGLKVTAFRIDTDEQSFSLRVTPQKQRVRTESWLEASWQDNQFKITQHFLYDVSYERLSQVRLSIPAALEAQRVRFFTSRDNELTPDILPAASGTSSTGSSTLGPANTRQVVLKLGESQLGHFEIQARFVIPFAKDSAVDTDAEVTLPIIGSVDIPFTQTRASLVQSDWFDAEPISTDTWTPQFFRQESWQWLADGSPHSLGLKIVRSTHAAGGGNVSHGLVTMQIDPLGQGRVRAQFRVTTRSAALPVLLPTTTSMIKFYWDERLLTPREYSEMPPESRRFTIQVPEELEKTPTHEHLLTIEYLDRFSSDLGWTESLELRPPQLPKCLWDSRVVIQVGLPAGQHLLTYPTSATPMFHWQRSGLIWTRKSEPGIDELKTWVAADPSRIPADSDLLFPEAAMNSYTFSQFGSPQPLVFQTLSSSMVLFLGMGFSLAVGFIMLRMVVVRHVMTLLLIGLCIAIFGLWFSAPLELLIQPMIVGLIFPATAVMLENWIRRRDDPGVMSFEGQGDFPPLGAFGSHYGVRQADPNEATVHRPLTRDSHPSYSVETGSGVS